ncbi:dTDP-4-dehydrorhamnose 3,5-epimerase [Epidermidibacterium keratini]|uniref:dTDP-4-dehydrorhamnose 3,5-epimerase n=1 Tax=Epidermidibacterium keratini TaxID=1891644 RepID=A0A7L4YS06_9ACTN|nr:dTDP-4-dehydrorhamnose 3,5-epimerase family protein [Epidermidibacterium keratini]QHC01674.1 dTDP-4-dehydrorhamnose 3,5-epimerase [Epidermidibacterium keratini]
MDVRELKFPGILEFTPKVFPDDRGVFLECFRAEPLEEALGHRLDLVQANHSVSRKGTVRGVHYALVPPGQAKYVYCPQGRFLDIVVDIRDGSPTFGEVDVVELDSESRRAIYVAEGIGHAVVALEDNSSLIYLCSAGYNPQAEKGLNPLDPALQLPIPSDLELLLSPKDTAAPTLAEAQEQGLLPSYAECEKWYATLRERNALRPS